MHHNGQTLRLTKADLVALTAYAGKAKDPVNRDIRFTTKGRLLTITASDGRRVLRVEHTTSAPVQDLDIGIDAAFLAMGSKLIKRAQWQTLELDLVECRDGANLRQTEATVIDDSEDASGPGATLAEPGMVSTQVLMPRDRSGQLTPTDAPEVQRIVLVNHADLPALAKVGTAAGTTSCTVYAPESREAGVLVEFHPKSGDLWSVWLPAAGEREEAEPEPEGEDRQAGLFGGEITPAEVTERRQRKPRKERKA